MTNLTRKKASLHKVAALTLAAAALMAPMFPHSAQAENSRSFVRKHSVCDTIFGVVTSDVVNNTFQMKRDNGNYAQVRFITGNAPRGLQRGNRVRVVGTFDNNGVLRNSVVTIIDGSNNNNGDNSNNNANVVYYGVVTSDVVNNTFQMRRDNGNYAQARFITGNAPRNLQRGNRVRVAGRLDNNGTVRNSVVTFDSGNSNNGNNGNNNNGNNGNGVAVDVVVTVASVQSSRLLTVRYDDGVLYSVRTSFNIDNRISGGDMVRIVGTLVKNTRSVVATRIDLRNDNDVSLNNNSGNRPDGARVDFNGTVQSITRLNNGGKLTVLGNGGWTWNVPVNSVETWNRGDLIRVRGTVSGNSIINSQVDHR